MLACLPFFILFLICSDFSVIPAWSGFPRCYAVFTRFVSSGISAFCFLRPDFSPAGFRDLCFFTAPRLPSDFAFDFLAPISASFFHSLFFFGFSADFSRPFFHPFSRPWFSFPAIFCFLILSLRFSCTHVFRFFCFSHFLPVSVFSLRCAFAQTV